jgi:filamentous hemagglutinin family protein
MSRRLLAGRLLVLVLAGVMLWAAFGQAQVPTSITSSGLGTTVTTSATTWNIDGGTRVGSNLFHSFGLFSVGAGNTANFNNTTGVATTNILGRVTGGQPSNIFGRIQTTNFSDANLFLINPAGWIFGPAASLSVGGAFHASTADYVRFPDLSDGTQVKFFADTSPLPSSGLTANPAAFGFLAPNPVRISLDRSSLQVGTGKTLSLVGGEAPFSGQTESGLKIVGLAAGSTTPSLRAPSGQIQVVSVASAGEVALGSSPGVTSFPSLGRIDLSNGARLDASGNPGGTVVIRGGQLIASQSSTILANTTGAANGATTAVDIQVSGNLQLKESSTLNSTTSGTGAGGGILVDAGTLTLMSGGSISSATGVFVFPLGFVGGPGGNVTVTAKDSILISDIASGIRTLTNSSSAGGKVTISAPSLTLANSGEVLSSSTQSGAGGDIAIGVRSLSIASSGNITSLTGNAAGGNLAVKVIDSATISGTGDSIFTRGVGQNPLGPAGSISLDAGTLTLSGGARIRSGDLGARSGPITVNAADSIVISGTSGITIQTFSENAATVSISAPTLTIDRGFVSTSTVGGGNAGPVNVGTPDRPVGTLTLVNGGQITSSSEGTSPGDGGNLTVYATGPVTIAGRSPNGQPVSPFSRDASSGLFSVASRNTNTANPGNAGQISVTTPTLTISDGAKISVATPGLGSGGNVVLNVGDLTLAGGARLDSSTEGAGQGGTLAVTAANSVSLSGSGTGLFSTASNTGAGGNINVQAPQVQISDGATISANSTGTATATAGNVNIVTSNLNMQNASITTEATLADGGNISITTTGSLVHLIDSEITTSVRSGVGSGGNITIDSDLVILDDSRILAQAFGGPGGNITINADVFLVNSGGMIPTSLDGIVDASSERSTSGVIDIQATVTDVSSTVSQLPEAPLRATELLRASCAARFAGGKASSLVLAGRDGLPIQPGGLLPSPLYLANEAGTPSMRTTANDLRAPSTLLGPVDSDNRLLARYGLLSNVKCAF